MKGRGWNSAKYGWDAMEPGNSMLFEGYNDTVTAKPYIAAMKYGSRNGKRFSGKKVPDGVVVTRVE